MKIYIELETLEDRLCFSAVDYHGGFVIAAPEFVDVDVTLSQDVQVRYTADNYLPLLFSYGVGQGSLIASLSSSVPNSESALAQKAIIISQQYGFNPSIVPIFFTPQGIFGIDGLEGWHSYTIIGSHLIPFIAVIDNNSVAHEMAEVCTDPFNSGYFNGDPSTGEICDLAGSQNYTAQVFNWQTLSFVSLPFEDFVQPDGSIYNGANYGSIDVIALAYEMEWAVFTGFAAHFESAFASYAGYFQSLVNSNPAVNQWGPEIESVLI